MQDSGGDRGVAEPGSMAREWFGEGRLPYLMRLHEDLVLEHVTGEEELCMHSLLSCCAHLMQRQTICLNDRTHHVTVMNALGLALTPEAWESTASGLCMKLNLRMDLHCSTQLVLVDTKQYANFHQSLLARASGCDSVAEIEVIPSPSWPRPAAD